MLSSHAVGQWLLLALNSTPTIDDVRPFPDYIWMLVFRFLFSQEVLLVNLRNLRFRDPGGFRDWNYLPADPYADPRMRRDG